MCLASWGKVCSSCVCYFSAYKRKYISLHTGENKFLFILEKIFLGILETEILNLQTFSLFGCMIWWSFSCSDASWAPRFSCSDSSWAPGPCSLRIQRTTQQNSGTQPTDDNFDEGINAPWKYMKTVMFIVQSHFCRNWKKNKICVRNFCAWFQDCHHKSTSVLLGILAALACIPSLDNWVSQTSTIATLEPSLMFTNMTISGETLL